MNRKLLSVLLVLAACFSCLFPVLGHGRDEHDEELEYVIFGDKYYSETHPLDTDKVHVLADAVYLCIDQFNGAGTDELKNLQNRKIPGIPNSIEAINFTSNFAHRFFTHRGWDLNYDAKAHWPERQQILLNTVEKELFSGNKDLISQITGIFNEENPQKDKIRAFSVMLYYVHILGDHIEAKSYGALGYIAPLTRPHEDTNNPALIPELKKSLKILFQDQADTYLYSSFMLELDGIEAASESVTNITGGVNTEEEFIIYHQAALDLLETLATYVPQLLNREEFFQQAFNF